MPVMVRLTTSIVLVLALLAGLLSVRYSLLCAAGLDPEQLRGVLHTLNVEWQRRERLTAACKAVNHRLEVKSALGRAVRAGRLSLPEAAERMRELLDASEPECWEQLRHIERGKTDEERLYWHVIGWVRAVMTERPEVIDAECARLEAVLGELLRGGG